MINRHGARERIHRRLQDGRRNRKTTASVVMDNISALGGESASMTMVAARDFFWGVERFLDTAKSQASGLRTHGP